MTAEPEPSINAERDAYVAGGDQYITIISQGQNRPGGLGEPVFTCSVGQHSGRLAVAFGADDTLVVTEQDANVHRWSLRDGSRLPGAAVSLPRNGPFRAGAGTAVAVSTAIPVVALGRGNRVILVHFTEDGHCTVNVRLGAAEFLVWGSGRSFATYKTGRVAVRNFADGTITWEPWSSPPVAGAALDCDGTTASVATYASRVFSMTSSNKVTVMRQDGTRRQERPLRNAPLMAGCQLGLSADGDLAVCASAQEISVFQTATGETVRRQRVKGRGRELWPQNGMRPQRLVCLPDARVLWLRDRHIAEVNWSRGTLRFPGQEGLCDDIAFDYANSRLAIVNDAGDIGVYEWPPDDLT